MHFDLLQESAEISTVLQHVQQGQAAVAQCNRGRTREKFKAFKGRLVAKNFTVNEDKCVSFSTTLSFLGHQVSSEGVKPEQKHVQKLLQIRRMSMKLSKLCSKDAV